MCGVLDINQLRTHVLIRDFYMTMSPLQDITCFSRLIRMHSTPVYLNFMELQSMLTSWMDFGGRKKTALLTTILRYDMLYNLIYKRSRTAAGSSEGHWSLLSCWPDENRQGLSHGHSFLCKHEWAYRLTKCGKLLAAWSIGWDCLIGRYEWLKRPWVWDRAT